MSSCFAESPTIMSGNQHTFLDTFKSGSKRFASLVADTGAKTMLKTDVAFLERDIKNRKHTFGIQIYDILQQQQSSSTSPSDTIFSASDEIQKAYEECKLDIETLEKKIDKKRVEMSAIGDAGPQQQQNNNNEGGGGGGDDGESASGRNAELESGILPGY
mmetsp:Transcript_24762/g.35435  ORF Transcript_24762/g.35435 Transcript_24762/m.35435 type:complete len:160 (-) Transcript_24762:176-655(-)